MFRKIGETISRHPVTFLVLAVMVLAGAIFVGPSVFDRLDSEGFANKNSESTKVNGIIASDFARTSSGLIILFHDSSLSVDSPEYSRAVEAALVPLKNNLHVARVNSYYTTGASTFVSRDRHSTFAAVNLKGTRDEQEGPAVELREKIKSDQLEVSMSGDALIAYDINKQIETDLALAESVSFAILAVLLVVVFRSVIAAMIPLLLGGFTIMVSFLVLRGMSELTTISQYAINVIIALGLGLAIDYSLLIIARFREELKASKNDVVASLAETMHTAGHTVFFSGLTVIICLLSLALFPLDMLRSMGLGGAAAVAVAMMAGLVVMPAILRLLGTRVNWLSFGRVRRDRRGQETKRHGAFWRKLTDVTMRAPIVTVVLTLTALLLAGSPLLGLNIVLVDQRALPASAQTRQVIDTLEKKFDFSNSPVQITYTADNLSSQGAIGHLYDYVHELENMPGVKSVTAITALPGQTLSKTEYQALLSGQVPLPAPLKEAIDDMRHNNTALITVDIIPATFSSEAKQLVHDVRSLPLKPGVSVLVGGTTAALMDQMEIIASHIPLAIAWIGVAIFILMFLMLGSVLLPIKAMLLNALSLAVSLGVLVWVFQDGQFADTFGLNADAGIEATQPIIIFAIAFGLSMDYSVFLYGRIKEEYDKSGDTRGAVIRGLEKTGGIITSAAILLFVVVVAFATSKIAVMQQIGVGLAVAVLVDAFIVRIVLVPASMAILGKWNWWAPKPLKKLHQKLGLDGGH